MPLLLPCARRSVHFHAIHSQSRSEVKQDAVATRNERFDGVGAMPAQIVLLHLCDVQTDGSEHHIKGIRACVGGIVILIHQTQTALVSVPALSLCNSDGA